MCAAVLCALFGAAEASASEPRVTYDGRGFVTYSNINFRVRDGNRGLYARLEYNAALTYAPSGCGEILMYYSIIGTDGSTLITGQWYGRLSARQIGFTKRFSVPKGGYAWHEIAAVHLWPRCTSEL